MGPEACSAGRRRARRFSRGAGLPASSAGPRTGSGGRARGMPASSLRHHRRCARLDNLERFLHDEYGPTPPQLDESQEAALERELSRQYHLITRDDRLETVARDIVQHFLGRGFLGKAMVISIDKATALRMHDKGRRHWEQERLGVETELARRYPREVGTEEYAEIGRAHV